MKAYEPGLLARANRGFPYIDEVKLLEDHRVDLLIDVAASGENVVEREGLSVRHPARIVLVGSGNPEGGELRPQLLDRFGLSVELRTPQNLASRVEVVKRRDAFEREASAFTAQWAKEEARVRTQIVAGRALISDLGVFDTALERAAQLCMSPGTWGHLVHEERPAELMPRRLSRVRSLTPSPLWGEGVRIESLAQPCSLVAS